MASAQDLEAYFSLTRFNVPSEKPYVDIFISFNGRTVNYINSEASIESTILIKEGIHIIDFRKTKVTSSSFTSDSIPLDFVDVQRFPLKNGKYSVEVFLRDLNLEKPDTVKLNYPFELFFSANKVEISDIEFVDRMEKSDKENLFSKGGFQVIPYVSDYFNPNRNEIIFYAEIYNSDNKFKNDGKYLAVAQITGSGGEVVGSYRRLMRHEVNEVNVILTQFDISELYSGNYNLEIEVRDKDNELIKSNSLSFFRNNPVPLTEFNSSDSILDGEVLFTQMIPDREVLLEYIRSMWPRADALERNIIDKQLSSSTTENLQQFMYTFWYKRDPNAPQEAWDKYNDMVKIVNNLYSTQIQKGYQTDRGRVFLQYGKPNKLVDIPSEPSAYPYQIWQYYHIDRYSNIRFVFYNKDLSTNDYVLLHSDMRGEVYYRRWDAELHSRTTPMNNIDENFSEPHEGSRARDYYDNPR